MPGLNEAAMAVASQALKEAMGFAQLHHEDAGLYGTANATTAPRRPVVWSEIIGLGDLSLKSPINFIGGESETPVYSVTLWSDAPTGGTYYGQFPINSGARTFSSSGEFTVSTLDLDGSAS